ncbi:WRKY DNA-binding transcription factor 70-like [Glycine soja]|uniref:Putative WRKY transcription factor 70 isoform A n=1 Tax=Glycine soja TaxID=3848 RepID=A0A445J796_GLYSO|nr:WRKY DNA-binding transcription factor 70-like [Glycine soja]KHN29497.1 Putative WRKY transcription factor 70 [Glycine soja]RZB94169.1 putative WRKY transcription factor 70 isoform A [Glycine soja]
MENLGGSSRRKAIEELLRGRDSAQQLKSVINGTYDDGSATPFAQQLVKEVLMSFTNSLLFLHNNPTSESHHVFNVQVWDSPKSEDSQESNCKSSTIKEPRGCYKRRRTEQTWEKESEAPIDDGHHWRKYGQKEILNAKFPRNYYRCTHKFDQGCQATKQVQRVQEEPILFKTTYYGHHTCKNLANPDIILDPMSPSSSSKFLSFDNSFSTPSKQECPFLSSSNNFPSSSSVKRECKEEVPPSISSNDYLISSDLTFDSSPRHHVTLSSTLDSEYKSVDISDVLYDSAQLDFVFEPFLEIR